MDWGNDEFAGKSGDKKVLLEDYSWSTNVSYPYLLPPPPSRSALDTGAPPSDHRGLYSYLYNSPFSYLYNSPLSSKCAVLAIVLQKPFLIPLQQPFFIRMCRISHIANTALSYQNVQVDLFSSPTSTRKRVM